MADMDTYAVSPRPLVGKRVSTLRRQGILPANIFGRGLESVAVQMPYRTAREMLIAHGKDNLVQVQIEGEAAPRPVVVRNYQRHPVTRDVLHLDFYQVDLTRPIQGTVPVRLTGEAPAVHVFQALLLTGADSIHVEALPADLPEHIEVSVNSMTQQDSVITVADLDIPIGIRVLTDPETMVARIGRGRVRVEAADLLEGDEPEAAGGRTADDSAETNEE
ncbi:MAG: 50S ribosomal protein L25 [Dehalococcoidia bacterium]|nr:50S ribosomal protein L25 [Dehalococcoidia bacterium]